MTTQTDAEIVREWLKQEPPLAEELTEQDVWSAEIALDVVHHYRTATKYMPLELDRTMIGQELQSGAQWDATVERARRGVAIINGYLLISNARVPVWQDAPTHKDAVVSLEIGGGYTAMQEYHRTLSLVTAGILVTISTAAEIIFGENKQSKRVMIAELMTEGYLQIFHDRTEANPQKSRRLSRLDVLRYKALKENS